MAAFLYVVPHDVHPDRVVEHERWYIDRHGPDLLRTAFASAQFFRTVSGAPGFTTIYDSPSATPFGTKGYAKSREDDDNLANAESHITNMTKGVFEVEPIFGTAGTPALDADFVTTIRFDAPQTVRDKLEAWLRGPEAEQLKREGAVRAHLGILRGLHPWHPKIAPPPWIVLIEWRGMPRDTQLIAPRLQAAFPDAVSKLAYSTGARVFRGTGASA